MSFRLIEKSIGYRFRQKKWIQMALTHPSYRHEHIQEENDNQRLEYVGDAVLGLLAAHTLYHRYPTANEGQLSTLRSLLTKDDTLAQIGRQIDLGQHLRLGKGELQNGGADRNSNIADALEALLGAAWQDGGRRAAEKIFNTLFAPLIEQSHAPYSQANPKGALQEYLQQNHQSAPNYIAKSIEGPDHNPQHTIEVVALNQTFTAVANNKREAEQEAARQALEWIQKKSN
jgi:ribonuclease-3